MAFKQLCDDEIAEFLINNERKESKIAQNILLNRCYLLFEEYVGPLQLAIHMVQNHRAGEQKSHWDKTNKT